MEHIITQTWAAKLPFRSRYPTSKVVSFLLSEARVIPPLRPMRVLDLTYGQGIWWDALKHRVVVAGLDVRRLDWVVKPKCFFESMAQRWRLIERDILDCLGGRPDVVAVDPPFQRERRGREISGRVHYREELSFGPPQQIIEAAADAARHYGAPMIVHYRERFIPKNFEVVVEAWWKPFLPNVDKYDYKNWWGVLRPRGGDR